MGRTTWIVPALAALTMAISPPAEARTDICYQGGIILPNWQLNGNAQLNGTDLLITPNTGTQRASAMFVPTFNSKSDIHIQMNVKITTTATGGADGMAFVMHNDPRGPRALGNAGQGIGYGSSGGGAPISPSVVVEMDTYQNGGEINANHIAIMRDGNDTNHLAVYTPTFTMSANSTFWIWIDYSAASSLLSVFVSQSSTKPGSAQLSYSGLNVNSYFGGQPFYMGFTGSTGGAWSQHEIVSFIASDSAITSSVCCASNSDCAAPTPVCDPVKLVCGECSTSTVSGCGNAPAGCNLGPSKNVCIPACNGNYGSGKSNACPTASAPVCVPAGPGAGSCVQCDGNSGSGTAFACPGGAPSCNVTGFCGLCASNADCSVTCNMVTHTCIPCNGDFGSGATSACPSAASPICDPGGRCTKCASDSTCTTGPHAGPYCDTVAGTCGMCTSDAGCAGAAHAGAVCDTMSGACSTCTSDAQCAGATHQGPFCDAAGSCSRCGLDSDCTSGAMHAGPFCRLSGAAATGYCTTCANDLDCYGTQHAGPLCLPSAGTCGASCTRDLQCGINQWCNDPTGAGGTCTAMLGNNAALPAPNTCTPLLGSRACTSGVCSVATNTCVACKTDSDCGSGTRCIANQCIVACTNDAQCAASQFCLDPNGTGGSCTAKIATGRALPSSCTLVLGSRACQSGLCRTSDNTCVQCVAETDCPTGNVCSANLCTPACTKDAQCGSGQWCNDPTGTGGACTAGIAAGMTLPYSCTPALGSRACITGLCRTNDNRCVQCLLDSDCSNGGICSANVCKVACTKDSQCSASQWCNDPTGTGGVCTNKLASNQTLPSGLACSPALGSRVCQSSLCRIADNTCVQCITTSDCSAGNLCINNTCSVSCQLDTQCTPTEWCASMGGGAGACTTKLVNGTAMPASLGGCNAITGARACQSGICRRANNTCVDCNADADCGLNAVCDNYACVSACNRDAQCSSGMWCNDLSTPVAECENKVASGAELPASFGACTPLVGARACQSGLCISSNNTCVECLTNSDCPDNGTCSDNNACQLQIAGGGCSCNTTSQSGSHAGGVAVVWFLLTLIGLSLRRRMGERH